MAAALNERKVEPTLEALLDLLPMGACVVDRDLIIVEWNEILVDWMGLPRQAAIGTHLGILAPDLVTPGYYSRMMDVFDLNVSAVFSSAIHKRYFTRAMRARYSSRSNSSSIVYPPCVHAHNRTAVAFRPIERPTGWRVLTATADASWRVTTWRCAGRSVGAAPPRRGLGDSHISKYIDKSIGCSHRPEAYQDRACGPSDRKDAGRNPRLSNVSKSRFRSRHYLCAYPRRRGEAGYPVAIAFVARIGNFKTLQSAERFASLGLVRPISQKYTQGPVTPTSSATCATERPRSIRALRRWRLRLGLRGTGRFP